MSPEKEGIAGVQAGSEETTVATVAHRLRERAGECAGFTLMELLVVMLIIGVLAAIAIPSFAGQKSKATDVQAKELARTAETTAETISTEDDGRYNAVGLEELKRAEPSIPETAGKAQAYLSAATGGTNEYSVTATSTEGNKFTITKSSSGTISRQCQSAPRKNGCAGSETSSW